MATDYDNGTCTSCQFIINKYHCSVVTSVIEAPTSAGVYLSWYTLWGVV